MSHDRHTLRKAVLSFLAACGLAASLGTATAAQILFDTPPFEGSTADPNDGVRTVFSGAERFLAGFNFDSDQFVFDTSAFGLTGPLSFINATAALLPAAGAQVIVLQDADNDGNPATPFNAGAAANLIAAKLDDVIDSAGFFVYWNSVLGVNRLVYSTNLSVPTADLAILARIQSPSGADAIAALPNFRADNFATVPEPGSMALLAAGLGMLAWQRRAAATARTGGRRARR